MRARAALLLAISVLACSELTEPGAEKRTSKSNSSALAEPSAASVQAEKTPVLGRDYIHAADILVAYAGASRAPASITRNKDEARKFAEELLERIRKGEDFAALARRYSDDPIGKYRSGDLQNLGRDDKSKAFIDVAFALKPGQLAGPVESPFGFHVILRKE